MGEVGAGTPEGAPRQAAGALASPAGRQLADELRRAKQRSGLSFARLEARTHYSRASIERYVNGKLFPGRDAVEDIARACAADPAPLLKLWDDALETGTPRQRIPASADPAPRPGPPSAAVDQPDASGSRRGPLNRRRRLFLIPGMGLALLLALGVFFSPFSPFSPFRAAPQPPAPTTGCRDYDADIRAYTVGEICWKAAKATVSGYVKNPDGPGNAVAQLCLSIRPNVCSRTIELATAGPGRTVRYQRTVALPPGHGVWVRACARGLCTQWG